MNADPQAVADRQAITDLIYRYCRAMDRIDVELGYSIWHADGTAHYEGFYEGAGRGFIDKVCENHRPLLNHSHQMSNIIIELNGERAASESYVTAALTIKRGDQIKQMTVRSRYVDRWSKRSGRWGIDKRIAIRDFDDIRDVTPMSTTTWGRRDPSDPSYAAFAELK
jgi:SnoaL-like domain